MSELGMTRPVLVVRLPCAAKAETLTEMRDYVLSSLQIGLLVLGDGITYAMEDFPALASGETPEVEVHGAVQPGRGSKEKMEILDRLRQYRNQHGLGCLGQLAKRCGRGVTEDLLRGLLTGTQRADLQLWRRIGAGLDRLSGEEGASE